MPTEVPCEAAHPGRRKYGAEGGAKANDIDTSLRNEKGEHRLADLFPNRSVEMLAGSEFVTQGVATRGEGANNAAKLVRACGGCLGARRLKGVEDCDKPGGAVKRALIPGYPS